MGAAILTAVVFGALSGSPEFQAGLARKAITPAEPLWMAGYASRDKPSQGVVHDLWAKALALDDGRGGQVVLVTIDLIGLPRELTELLSVRAKEKIGLRRDQLLFNTAHTHCGPGVWPNLSVMFDIDSTDKQRLVDYSRRLADDLLEVVEKAVADLRPAVLSVGHGSASFTVNRRQPTNQGVQLGVNPDGPVDHDVPVLKIAAADGKLRAVLFGYACHNTTLGDDAYQINGDYAGFAQIELEKAMPGTTAMFLMLCGGDQNPHPRGTRELAQQHGKTLANAVQKALAGRMHTVDAKVRTAFAEAQLELAQKDRSVFEQEAGGEDRFRRRRAEAVLATLDAGRPVWQLSIPVHAVRLGEKLTILALGGEVVIDYPLRLKKEFPQPDLIVAGYTDEVLCYVPSRRVLEEGGYEPDYSMIFYGQPGPFTQDVEEKIIDVCRRLLAQVGVQP